MITEQTLAECGFDQQGGTATTVTLAGFEVAMQASLDSTSGVVEVVAGAPCDRNVDAELLRAFSLAAQGDTAFDQVDGMLVARRHLQHPSSSGVYDTAHELAKAMVRLALAVAERVQLSSLSEQIDELDQSEPVEPAEPVTTAQSDSGFWVCVEAPQSVVDSGGTVTTTLQPGQWYLADRDEQGSVHVHDDAGIGGWIRADAVRRA